MLISKKAVFERLHVGDEAATGFLVSYEDGENQVELRGNLFASASSSTTTIVPALTSFVVLFLVLLLLVVVVVAHLV